jgi:hypothetical protein
MDSRTITGAQTNASPADWNLFCMAHELGRSTQILFGGMCWLREGSMVVTHNKSYSLTAEIEVPASGANGVIIASGGGVGGWSLYVLDGKLKHCYNFFGIKFFFAEGLQRIAAGTHRVRMEFKYDGRGLGRGGTVSLFVDGKKDGESRVDMTVPMVFSADETCDVGRDNKFSGQVNWVQIDLEKDDFDHLIAGRNATGSRWHGSKIRWTDGQPSNRQRLGRHAWRRPDVME